jgi:hypothetical protein
LSGAAAYPFSNRGSIPATVGGPGEAYVLVLSNSLHLID